METQSNKPKLATKILYHLLSKNDRDFLIGDFEEFYDEIKEEKGKLKANLWYCQQVFKSLPHFINNSIYWRIVMFNSYLKIALRNFRKNKLYFSLNVTGLALGLALFLLSAFELDANYHFDNFHKNADRIYGIVQSEQSGNQQAKHFNYTAALFKPSFESEFPEVEDVTRFYFPGETVVRSGDDVFYENKVVYGDPELLSLFTFPLISGSKNTALSEPDKIVLTRETAEKYFGSENPIGKILKINKEKDHIVSGVLQKLPNNSSLKFDFLLPINALDEAFLNNRDMEYFATFFSLKEGFTIQELEAKLAPFAKQHYPKDPEVTASMYTWPLLDFHLKALHINSFLYRDTPFFFYLGLGIVSMFLLVVCFNFMSLSIAQYINRGKEVVMRKVVGANRAQLVKQFLGESVIIAVLALPLAIIIFELIKTPFYTYFNNYYDLTLWDRPWPILYALLAAVTAGIISGCYPAFYLSAFQPVKVLKGNLNRGKKGNLFRKSLVVAQFAIAALLIIFSLTLNKQFDYLLHMDLGYDREQVVIIPVSDNVDVSVEPFKKQLAVYSDIAIVTGAGYVPFNWNFEKEVVPENTGKEDVHNMHYYGVDHSFLEALNIQMKEGRSFSKQFNEENSFIITASAAQELGWQQPLGKELTIDGKKGTIVGVTNDFYFSNIFKRKLPSVLYWKNTKNDYLYVKAAANADINRVKAHIEKEWKAFAPDIPLELRTLDNWFEISINGIQRMSNVVAFVGFMTIAVSCIGLFALAAYTISRRTKEIGIRKVLGASTANISMVVIMGFLKLVALANLIAWPLAWFGINQYLNMSASRIGTPYDIFLLVTLMSLLIAVIAVMFKTVNAARANPVESLKYE